MKKTKKKNQSSLFDIRNGYNIIITMWKKKKDLQGNGKRKKVCKNYRAFPNSTSVTDII